MAAALGFDINQKYEFLMGQMLHIFDELLARLGGFRENLRNRLIRMKEGNDRNAELAEAIRQLRILKESSEIIITSNLLQSTGQSYDEQIQRLEQSKVTVENLEFVEFRCYSDKILKTIAEIDLVELIPEYVRRENPILKVCEGGRENGELYNPNGIAVDRARNELYICDTTNKRIQVLNTEGMYLRSFGTYHLKEPWGICISQEEVFVTDRVKESLVKFSLAGQFLMETGSRGTTAGRFIAISGLCYESGLVYVCDCSMQRIQIFDSNLKFVKKFGYGELKLPTDITVFSDTIYILLQSNNSIYCYNRDCTLRNIIQLTGQDQPMIGAFFFTIDKKGNFLITDQSANEIRIFSPQGVMKHILGRGHHSLLKGITLDNSDKIICVSHGIDDQGCFQKY